MVGIINLQFYAFIFYAIDEIFHILLTDNEGTHYTLLCLTDVSSNNHTTTATVVHATNIHIQEYIQRHIYIQNLTQADYSLCSL